MTAVNTINATQEPVAERPPQAKWGAIVSDVLLPLPRRHMKARDVLFQANAPAGSKLIRDLNDPVDVAFTDDAEVDFAQGNVFRLGCECESHEHGANGAPAKLAFVVDDAWEVTTNPEQTEESLRGLFDLPDDVEFLRDFESPTDKPIDESEHVRFEDGPVFRTRRGIVTVEVNTKPVKFKKRRVTGLVVKQTAIQQGVAIQLDFVLYRELPDGGLSSAIGNDQHITLHECEKFVCVAPDDNS